MRDFFQDHALDLAIIDRNHPKRGEVEHYIAQRYSLAFDARLNCFMPTFMALMDKDHIKSLCGYRVASEEALFLEQYLDHPADELLASAFSRPIDRAQLIEFGQLASFSKGFSSLHFLLMTQKLVEQGYEWCIFTATDPLYVMMCRLGLDPTILAEADPTRIPDAHSIWGNYYQYQPRIVAGNLKGALAHLQALFSDRKHRLSGGFS
ncbi:delta-VPH [Vibrio fluvialis]|nr:delta-VPH [Vibrio fluvialis]